MASSSSEAARKCRGVVPSQDGQGDVWGYPAAVYITDGMEPQLSWCRQYNRGQQPQTAAPRGGKFDTDTRSNWWCTTGV